MGVVIQAIRDSARGERCTFCNDPDDSTVVFCHGPRFGTAGAGQKVDDWWGAYGCAACHRAMDEHRYSEEEEKAFWLGAIARTQRRLYERGIMAFPEKPAKPKTVSKIVPHSGRMRRSP